MGLLSLLNQLSGLIALIIFFATIIGFYWKIKIEIKTLKAKDNEFDIIIENIQLDRKERWANYRQDKIDYKQDKEKLFEICENLNNVMSDLSGTIKAIKNDLGWLKKEK